MVQNAMSERGWRGTITPRSLMVGAIALVTIGGAAIYMAQRSQVPAAPPPVTTALKPKTVTALGRLEPQGEVINLSAPTSTNGNRVEQLLVQEGDRVKKGQIIAILDGYDRLKAALAEAEEQIRVAEAQLAQVEAGAKQGEILAQQAEIARLAANQQGELEAQRATIARLAAEVANAEVENQRYEALYRDGAVSASQRDSKRLTLETARRSLQQAEVTAQRLQSVRSPELAVATATLNRIAEVRPVDVAVAQVDVDRAIAAANQARASLEQATVKAPQDGIVMKLHTRAGEVVGSNGIAELGQTSQMMAVAEVYQSDVSKVKPGQGAIVTSDSIPGELRGTVQRIGWQVQRQQVINSDPSENIDARIVEVYVALDAASSQKAAKFTNLQVQVVIQQ